jgi:hypothetical protein
MLKGDYLRLSGLELFQQLPRELLEVLESSLLDARGGDEDERR